MDAFPDEILLQIIDHLVVTEFEHDRCLVWGLSLVSRRFHRLVKSHLYHTYSLKLGNPESFLRTISHRPDLAKCVKHVDWEYRERNSPSQCYNILSVSERVQIATRLQKSGTAFAIQLATRFLDLTNHPSRWEVEQESYLCALLLLSPGIETLDIFVRGAWTMDLYRQLVHHSESMTNLKSVSLHGAFGLRECFPLIMIPSIRTLRLDSVWLDMTRTIPDRMHGVEVDHENLECLRERSSYLEHLHIKRCNSGTNDLVKLFPAFRGLRTFEYRKSIGWHVQVPDSDADNRAISECILSQRHSLQSLHLQDWYCSSGETAFQVLRKVSHLQFLDIKAPWLSLRAGPAADVESFIAFLRQLPSTLQCLTLAELSINNVDVSSQDVVEILLALAPIIGNILPSLTRLAMTDWDILWATFPCQIQLKALQAAYTKVGIKFESRSRDWTAGHDLYGLDYVEQGWVWIQSIRVSNGKWLKNCGYRDLDPCTIMTHLADEDDWVNVSVRSRNGRPCPASMLVVDQYLAEHSSWYWAELHARTS